MCDVPVTVFLIFWPKNKHSFATETHANANIIYFLFSRQCVEWLEPKYLDAMGKDVFHIINISHTENYKNSLKNKIQIIQ